MLQKLEPHISECLERASDCRTRAARAEDDALKTELLDLERSWTHLARSYEFVERFVLSARASRARTAMTRPIPILIKTPGGLQCPVCEVPLRLYGIEAHPDFAQTDLQTFVCPGCDGVQTQVVPAEETPRRRSHMETQAQLPLPTAFDAETTRLLGASFDAAWEAVLASGNPLADARYVASLRETLARRIIEMVQQGERNPNRLAEDALLPLGLSRSAKIELSS